MKEQELRQTIREILREEVSPNTKKALHESLEREIRKCMDDVLMRHNVEQKGLSEGQVAWLFRKLNDTVRDKLDEYQTVRRPKNRDLQQAAEEYRNR